MGECVGLEIHAQINAESKLFSNSPEYNQLADLILADGRVLWAGDTLADQCRVQAFL